MNVRLTRRPVRWIVLAGLLPIVVALVRFLPGGITLDGDEAVFALQAGDAATGGFPTVGLYSRFRWNHPGPAAFYLFAPFHWISGGAGWGMVVGSAAWSAAAMTLVGWLASRRRGIGFVAVAVAVEAATWIALGRAAPIDPWTPILAATLVVPFLLAAWGAAEGDGGAAAVGLVLATLLVQLHVGYLVIVAGVAVAVVLAGWDRRRSWRTRAVLVGAAMCTVFWAPVVIDLVAGRTHNVSRLWRYFRRADPPSAGFAAGARIVAREIAPLPNWLTGLRTVGLFAEAATAPLWWLVVPVALLAAGRAVAHRAGDTGAERFVTVAAGALVAALLAAAQLRGIRFGYLVYWRTPIVLTALVAGALAVRHRLSAPAASTRLRVVALGLAGAAIVGATVSPLVTTQVTRHGDEVGELLAAIPQVPRVPVLVRLADTGFVGAAPGTVLWLEEHGADVGVDPSLSFVFGDRTMEPTRAGTVWYVTDTGWAFSVLSALPGATVIAERTPFDGATEAHVRGLQRELADTLRRAGFADDSASLDSPLVALALGSVPKIDHAALEELAKLNETFGSPGTRFGIVAFAPDDLPTLPWRLAGF